MGSHKVEESGPRKALYKDPTASQMYANARRGMKNLPVRHTIYICVSSNTYTHRPICVCKYVYRYTLYYVSRSKSGMTCIMPAATSGLDPQALDRGPRRVFGLLPADVDQGARERGDLGARRPWARSRGPLKRM